MKRFFPALVFGFALLWVALSWLPQKPPTGDVDLAKFGKIPVLVGGRVKPLDTVARNSLLIIQGRKRRQLAEESANSRRIARPSGSLDTCLPGNATRAWPL